MFRATSEMAVAMNVPSVTENPSASARSRPACRAATMSASLSTPMRVRSPTGDLATRAPIEHGETLLDIEGRLDVLQAHAEQHHRERHPRLDADEDRDRIPG